MRCWIALLAATLLLAGCTSDDAPAPTASPPRMVGARPGMKLPPPPPPDDALPVPGSKPTTMQPVPVDVPLYPGADVTDAKTLHMEGNGRTWQQNIDELRTTDSVDQVVAFYSGRMNVRLRHDGHDGPHRVVTLSTSKAADPQPGIAATWVQVEEESKVTIVTLNTIR